MGSHKPGFDNCGKLIDRVTNKNKYQSPKNTVISNVVAKKSGKNSDRKSALPENNIEKISKAVIQT